MTLSKAAYVIGSHCFFFRKGDSYTVPDSGTCAREAKPGATDTGWIDLGVIENAQFVAEDQRSELWRPSPGRLQLYELLQTKPKRTIKFTCGELSAFGVELVYQTLSLTSSSTQFNPLEGAQKDGWLKMQSYDQDNNVRVVLDVFAALKTTDPLDLGATDICKVSLEATVLYSTYNTATL